MTVTINGTTGITSVNGTAAAPSVTGADTDTGIVYGTNTLSLATGGTTAVTVDSSQNVGIGTSSPGTKLQVNSSTTTASNNVAWDTTGSTLNLAFTGTSATDAGSSISFNDQGTTGLAAIKGAREATSGNGYLSFLTRNGSGGQYATERARIDSSGNLLVGTTTAGLTNSNSVTLQTNGPGGVLVANHSGTASGSAYTFFAYNGSSIGGITQNGTTAVAYNTSSDYRLKNTIAPMTGALARVAALKPCTYKWNADGSEGQGFIAHELAEVVPQCVTGEKDAVDADGNPQYQGIDTSFLVATLTAAIQELKAIVDAQGAEIAALKGTQA